jgi:ABC-2 type transport system permease protein
VLAAICLVGPFAFAVVLTAQSASPGDALFGVWAHSTGFALSLVVLGFAGSWGFPVMAGVLGGDVFSSEDRYGTWKTVLTRSCTRAHMFAGKVLATGTLATALVVVSGVSSTLAGGLVVGHQSLVGLDGAVIASGRALGLVLTAWLVSVLPMLAFTSLALLFSIASRSGIIGVIGPALVALASQLVSLIGKGVWAHTLLPGSAFDGWHGLFRGHPFYGQLSVSLAVSAAWIAGSLTAAWLILARRDFASGAAGPKPGWARPIAAVGGVIALIALLAFASNWGPAGITVARLRAAIGPTVDNLTLLQQRAESSFVPANAQIDVVPYCAPRAGTTQGPGDWTCVLDVFIPTTGIASEQQTPVTYDVSVSSDGCYKAEAPPGLVGGQTIRSTNGRVVVNPLFVIYGCFDPL